MSSTKSLDREYQTLEKPHQLREQSARSHNAHGEGYDLKERGFWCAQCGSKCSLGLNSEEYGHARSCEHAIEK